MIYPRPDTIVRAGDCYLYRDVHNQVWKLRITHDPSIPFTIELHEIVPIVAIDETLPPRQSER